MEDIEAKLTVAKLNDKLRICKTRNKIVNTEFLNMYQEGVIKKELSRLRESNYIFTGGYENANGKILVLYPEKFKKDIVQNAISAIIKAIEIKLPNNQIGKYQHKDYLGTIMQFGLTRERIGDIIVHDNMAYIIVLQENAQYIKDELQTTTKFKKSKIEIINVNEMIIKEPEFDEFKIITSSLRLDNVVSEIAKISRKESNRLITEQKVSINCQIQQKSSKSIEIGDILIIRGKGKYVVNKEIGVNSKGKKIIEIKKYK